VLPADLSRNAENHLIFGLFLERPTVTVPKSSAFPSTLLLALALVAAATSAQAQTGVVSMAKVGNWTITGTSGPTAT
jgi:hypothetical protein